MATERNEVVTVLLMVGYAFLFFAARRSRRLANVIRVSRAKVCFEWVSIGVIALITAATLPR